VYYYFCCISGLQLCYYLGTFPGLEIDNYSDCLLCLEINFVAN